MARSICCELILVYCQLCEKSYSTNPDMTPITEKHSRSAVEWNKQKEHLQSWPLWEGQYPRSLALLWLLVVFKYEGRWVIYSWRHTVTSGIDKSTHGVQYVSKLYILCFMPGVLNKKHPAFCCLMSVLASR